MISLAKKVGGTLFWRTFIAIRTRRSLRTLSAPHLLPVLSLDRHARMARRRRCGSMAREGQGPKHEMLPRREIRPSVKIGTENRNRQGHCGIVSPAQETTSDTLPVIRATTGNRHRVVSGTQALPNEI